MRKVSTLLFSVLAISLFLSMAMIPAFAGIYTGSGVTQRKFLWWVLGTWRSNAEVDTSAHKVTIWWDGPEAWTDGYHWYTWAWVTTIYMFDGKGWSALLPCTWLGAYESWIPWEYPNSNTVLNIMVGWTYVGITIFGGPCADEVWVSYSVYVGN